jgi:hypothetical protein
MGGAMSIAKWSAVVVLGLVLLADRCAAEVSQADFDALKKEIADLRKDNDAIRKKSEELASKTTAIKSSTDKALESKYGPGASVVTKAGKLTISAMVQVWYYSIQNDNKGLFEDDTFNDIHDSNEASDNDSFRIRRTELRFTMDLNEYVGAEIMIDPAREAQTFAGMNVNTATAKRALNTNLANVQAGTGAAPRLLQDAFVTFRKFVPHHDFRIGQFKAPMGEEALRSASQLDFVERSILGQKFDLRDQGISAHGEWWGDDGKGAGRFQYWLGAFNAPGNYHDSGGQFQNRNDDNDEKDFNYRVLVRPLWKNACFGDLELGFSSEMGIHGESSARDPIDTPLNGLNRNQNWAIRHDAWAYYAPGSVAKGWWMRGEWAAFKDRNAPQQVIDLLGQGGATGDQTTQTNGKPFWASGWYFSTGYKFADSVLAKDLCNWAKKFELTFRYESFGNVTTADLVKPEHTDVFKTQIFTSGFNYYIQGHNAKIQVNYNHIKNPDGDNDNNTRNFHNVRNDSFIVNFQVAL